jgi:hypothetical protein
MPDVQVLKDSGMDIDSMSADEQAAIQRLDQDEVDTLARIRSKLNNGADDVSGHAMSRAGDGGFVW